MNKGITVLGLRNLIVFAIILALATPVVAQAFMMPEPFIDVTKEAGIDTAHRSTWDLFSSESFTTGYLGMGIAWGDYDNDGWVDLYLTGGWRPSTLYRNNGDGTFSVSEFSPDVSLPEVWTGGAVWVDYDNDGFKDLYVLAHGANILFRNQQGQGFRDVTLEAGVGDPRRSSHATWGDYNNDGYLDLFVANWACVPECRPADPLQAADRLYRNNGDGTFSDVSYLLEAAKLQGAAFSASFVDFNNNGYLDIYVVNDMVEHPIGNVLWRNDGPGCGGWCWHDASSETGTGAIRNGMGLAVGDFDNDLNLDFYFSDLGAPMSLLKNRGTHFENVTEAAGVGALVPGLVGWGTAFFDLNNDGWLDLLLANTRAVALFQTSGDSGGLLFPQPNVLFQNQGDGTFQDITPLSWIERPRPSVAVAYADYDQDGFMDFVVGNFNVGYTLYRNAGVVDEETHWLTLRLEGRPPVNRDAIGARAFVTTADGLTRMQEVKTGSSLGGGDDTALHFGLGKWSSASVKVLWPDGHEVVLDLAANRIWRLVYGQTVAE